MPAADALPRVSMLTLARRIVAGAFLLAWVAVAWISYETTYLQACSDQIARVGNSPLIRSCEPLSLLDPPLLVLLVAAGLLVLPDMKAIEIPGILRLEREVAEQRKGQEELSKTVQDIKLDINVNLNQAAERAADTTKLVDALPEKIATGLDAINKIAIEIADIGENGSATAQETSDDKTSHGHADQAHEAPPRTQNDDRDVTDAP